MTPQPKIYVAGHRGMVGSAIVRQLQAMDCHVAGASRNDGKGAVIASEAPVPSLRAQRGNPCQRTAAA